MQRWTWVATVIVSACVGAAASTFVEQVGAAAKTPSLTALDYQEISIEGRLKAAPTTQAV